MDIKRIVERSDTPAGKAFDLSVQVLIVVSLVSFSIETLPALKPEARRWLNYIEYVCVAIFTAEYLLRLFVSTKKLGFVFSFYGLIDLAAILPTYLASGVDLRSLRAFRMLRLFRIFKLVRYNRAVRRFQRAFSIAREELVLFFGATAIMLYLSAVGIYYFENPEQPEEFRSVFDGLWWAVVSLTTVGYGDISPVTPQGKVFTAVVLFIGLGIVAVPTGLVASALTQARDEERGEDAET